MKEILHKDLQYRASLIKWFFCDIDGTLTDGGVYYSPDGELLKRFSLRDGTGFFLLHHSGIKTGFITTESSKIVEQRAQKLKISRYIYGTHKKLEALQAFALEEGLSLENVAYIGDEINDLKLLSACGIGFAVADADIRVREIADIICVHKGGHGAFREAVEVLLKLKGICIEEIIDKDL